MRKNNCEKYWRDSSYLPFDAALTFWCQKKDPDCREAKKWALITALQNGDVLYVRNDNKDFPDPIEELIGRHILMVDMESLKKWVESLDEGDEPTLTLRPREEGAYLNIIGMFHEIFIQKIFGDMEFDSAAKFIDFAVEKYGEFQGISQSNLEKQFAKIKKRLDRV